MQTDYANWLATFNQYETARANTQLTAQGLTAGLQEEYDNLVTIVNAYNKQLGYITGTTVTIAGITTTDDSSRRTTRRKSHATGLDYVPYNGYAATLHEGEAVLTKAEAQNWRGGDSSGSGSGVNLAASLAAALHGLSVQMDGTTVGHLVSDTVSKDIESGARARRFG